MTAAQAPTLLSATREAPTHSRAFRTRRLQNWLPLGCTYACLYMGRYNFNVTKGAIGAAYHFSKAEMGIVATVGFWVYALSVLVNGPLADRFGGRRAILVGTAGAAALNALIGLLFYARWDSKLILAMSLAYGANMYFQSFGALSVVKVNAAWFHVRERGVLGGVFGMLISLGYALAYGVCGIILEKMPLWAVYAIPSLVIGCAFGVDALIVRDRPSDAGHADFPTGDETATETGDPEREPTFRETLRRVFGHPVIRWLVVAEFCTGLVRQGLLLYFPEFLGEVHGVKPGTPMFQVASIGITVGGIAGGLLCGILSDKVFDSRRPPVAFLFYLAQIVFLVTLGLMKSPFGAAFFIGANCAWIFGVHGMLSGTASADFGGKKAAATATGLLDGVQYLGSGLTGVGLGWLLDRYHWGIWPFCLAPFSMVGALIMLKLWNARAAGAH
jgi:MFS transporter, OPA family, glycerol-3-phosphate transporter